jgi:hypothetical protein
LQHPLSGESNDKRRQSVLNNDVFAEAYLVLKGSGMALHGKSLLQRI